MLTPSIINLVSFFYPVGNTPAVCLTQNLPPKEKADLLLLGCGDVRNILFTTYCEGDLSSRDLDITCCDAERSILARNILLLTTLLDDVNGQNHEIIWQIYYHLLIDSNSLEILQAQSAKLLTLADSLQSWQGSTYGQILRFYDQETLDAVKTVWKAYSASTLNDVRSDAALQKARDTRIDFMSPGIVATGLRSVAPVSYLALQDMPMLYEYFWKHGTTDVDTAKTPKEIHPNPMFAPLDWDTITLHYGTDPHVGFPLAAAYIPLTRDSPLYTDGEAAPLLHKATEAVRFHFLEWSNSFRQHSSRLVIRFFAGDALTFCHTLQGKRATGRDTSHWYRNNYSLKALILPNNMLDPLQAAPLSFDVIDTSNLVDHLGSINIIIATSPLLKRSISASLFTESLVLREATLNVVSDQLLCGNFPSMSVLLNLVPVEYWTNATSISAADEILFKSIVKLPNDGLGDGNRTVKGQIYCRMAWKGAIPTSGDSDVQKLHFQASDLALVMFQVYQNMFQHEHLDNTFSSPNRMATRNNSCINYHRGSFASLLRFIKPRVHVAWEKMMRILLQSMEQDTTILLGRGFRFELYLHLHHFEVYSVPEFRPDFSPEFEDTKCEDFMDGLGAWKNIPATVCLTLEVPRAKLGVFTNMRLATLSTPLLQTMIHSDAHTTPEWLSIYADIHLAFGKIVTSGRRNDENYKVSVEEDPQGWRGSSPLVVCFYIPACVLLFDPQRAEVIFGIQATPQTAETFRPILGWDMNIFSVPLKSERHVHISRYAPNHSGYPLAAQFALQPSQSSNSETLVTIRANVEESTAHIWALTGRFENYTKETKIALRAGAALTIVHSPPFALSLQIGESETSYEVHFPAPVLERGRKTRIAHDLGIIEVMVPLADTCISNELPFFMYPILSLEDRVVIVNMPYVNLQRLPIIDVSKTEKIPWINPHVARQMSARERVLRDANMANTPENHKEARLDLKDSLFSLFLHASGLQGAPVTAFAISHPNRGGTQILILVNCLRFDLSNHTVILDAAVLPLTKSIIRSISRFLETLPSIRFCSITVDDDELRLWKEIIPVLVERCRDWEHLPSCEYNKSHKIPLSIELGKQILCSCGCGIFPENFSPSVPGWDIARKYAVRAAISPSFSVPYVERTGDCGNNADSASTRRCQTCKKEDWANGVKLLKCSGCSWVWYCSQVCQRADWKDHKRLCKLATVE